jgi:hypothetical protein
MKNKIKNKSGQVAIIVLLVSAVLLTIGLSSSRKTITDVKVDTDEGLLKDAFNAAESGINNYINNKNNKEYSNNSNGAAASVKVTNIGNGTTLFSESLITSGSNQLFWLVNHNDNGGIGGTYYAGASVGIEVDEDFEGALKIDYFYKNGANYGVKRLGCKYSTGGDVFDNGFVGRSNCETYSLTGNPLLIVITPIGGDTKLTLTGSSNFPIQGEELTSVGTAGNGIKTQIKTRHSYQTLPSFFIESMVAGNIIQ